MSSRILNLIRAPDFGNNDRTRNARLLHAILTALLAIALLYLFAAPFLESETIAGMLANTATIIVYIAILYLLRRGYVNLASAVFSAVFLLMVTMVAVAYGGSTSPAFFSFFTSIVIAGLLMGGRAATIFAGLSIGIGLCLTLLDDNGMLPQPLLSTTPYTMWWIASANFAMVAILTHLTVQGIHTSLKQAQKELQQRLQAEKELASLYGQLEEQNRSLEVAVTRRTAELEHANANLIRLGQIKDQFISNVSHELRTPIANLQLRIQLMRINPKRAVDDLMIVENETLRLQATIEDLLRLSRLTQGREKMDMYWFDINHLVKQQIDDRRCLFANGGLTIKTNYRPDALMSIGDEGLIGQVLSILMTNAQNYASDGKELIVSTHQQRQESSLWHGFSVADKGPGIDSDEIANLFDRFYRGRVGVRSGTPGTGLGLSIAKEIVDHHQGRLEIESSGIAGEGSTFWVWLPVPESSEL